MLNRNENVLKICKILDDKAAEDILAIDVADKTIITEWFIICSGHSITHVKALCDEVEDKTAEMGLALRRTEGYADGRWIVMDFSDILVHIFYPDERKYYNMERLWIDDKNACIVYPEQAKE